MTSQEQYDQLYDDLSSYQPNSSIIDYNAFLTWGFVPDLINDNKAKILFILESPYQEEVNTHTDWKCRYPVAGTTGRNMTKQFVKYKIICDSKIDTSLGELIKNRCSSLKKSIHIMNCVQIPLQCDTNYSNCTIASDLISLKKHYENHMDTTKYPVNQKLNNYLINNFQIRLEKYMKSNQYDWIIPCGWVAKNFLNDHSPSNCKSYLITHKFRKDDIWYITHPTADDSDNNWTEQNSKYAKRMNCLFSNIFGKKF